MPLFKELFQDLRRFFIFLSCKKVTSLNFGLTFVSLLFIPAQGYYQTVNKISEQRPLVAKSDFVLPPPVSYPKNTTGVKAPYVSAQGLLIYDPVSSVKLLEKNSRWHFLPASTTKMMTALVALDYFRLDDILTVPKIIDEGQNIKLIQGEKMTFESLLYALLVASANDAAETLAQSYPGGREAFVARMNEKASQLSLGDTQFMNPTGIDEPGHYSSPFDLVLLAKYALANPTFAKTVQTKEITLTDIKGVRVHKIENVNQLLGKVEGVVGVKTGWTERAGECLVSFVERNERKIIIVVLGSQDRFGETEKLIDWVFENFQWVEPI